MTSFETMCAWIFILWLNAMITLLAYNHVKRTMVEGFSESGFPNYQELFLTLCPIVNVYYAVEYIYDNITFYYYEVDFTNFFGLNPKRKKTKKTKK